MWTDSEDRVDDVLAVYDEVSDKVVSLSDKSSCILISANSFLPSLKQHNHLINLIKS